MYKMNKKKLFKNTSGSKKMFFVFFLLAANSFICFSQIDTVVNRLRNENIIKVVEDSKISGYLTTFKTDGSYSDVDYTSTAGTAWPEMEHLYRLLDICIVYNKPSSSFYHSPVLKAKIKSSFDFFAALPVKSINWWYEAIGVPIVYGPALILMKTNDAYGFDQTTLTTYSAARLKYFTQSIALWPGASSGANKVWLLNGSIHKAAIENDATILKSNFSMAFSEVKVFSGTSDGIKQDYSFYQHGPQLYCAGYGLNFLSDITYFGLISKNTIFEMTETQMKLLSDVTIEGYHWFSHKSAFDFGSSGREISREGAFSTAGLVKIIDRLISLNATRLNELQNCKSYLNGTSNFQSPGNKHFWKMDMMVQHASNFYLSAKIPSKRTVGTEWMNGENLRGKNLSWGATNIMISGEEYRGIFPTWDWNIIPGVTSCKETITKYPTTGGANLIPLSTFSGGVSNGSYGFAAYDYAGFTSKTDLYIDIKARKSYFFTPEAMYCMGIGIDANKSNPIITAVNQCYSLGDVTLSTAGVKSVFTDTLRNYRTLNWLHHNQVGYIFPTTGNNIYVGNKNQSGTWYDINTSGSKTKQTNKVFSAWFNHGNMPVNGKYEYIVVPSKNLSQFETWTSSNPLKSIVNEKNKQAIYDTNAGIYGIVFYSADSILLDDNFKVWADSPCLLLIEKVNTTNTYKISIADPTASLAQVNIKLSKVLKGSGVTINTDNSSTIKFILPTGENTGKTISADFQYENLSTLGSNTNNEDFRVSISPNPATDYLNIRLTNIEKPTIKIIELSAKVLYQITPEGTAISIDTKHLLKNGMYFVKVEGTNYSKTTKVIVKRD